MKTYNFGKFASIECSENSFFVFNDVIGIKVSEHDNWIDAKGKRI